MKISKKVVFSKVHKIFVLEKKIIVKFRGLKLLVWKVVQKLQLKHEIEIYCKFSKNQIVFSSRAR